MKILRTLTSVAALGSLLCAPAAVAQTRFATLYTFPDDNPAGLVYANGVFYGGSSGANSNCGTVFELQPPTAPGAAWTETTLYSFPIGGAVGCGPYGAQIVGPGGVLYGIAGSGPAGGGVIYELQPPASQGEPWTETLVYSFTIGTGTAGGSPSAILPGPNGSLYVITSSGGLGFGALDQLLPPSVAGGTWTAVLLYSLPSNQTGASPDSLTKGPGGVLYTAAGLGGPLDDGAIFELFPPSTEGGAWTGSILYTFAGDGAAPNGLILGPNGSLYGTTIGDVYAGGGGAATVFQLTPPAAPGGIWTETILKTFHGTNLDCGPDSPLILRNGKLYVAACQAGGGAVFELDPPSTPGGAWTSVTLHRFYNQQVPGGAMVMTSNGVIFGATALPSTLPPGGTIFEIIPK